MSGNLFGSPCLISPPPLRGRLGWGYAQWVVNGYPNYERELNS